MSADPLGRVPLAPVDEWLVNQPSFVVQNPMTRPAPQLLACERDQKRDHLAALKLLRGPVAAPLGLARFLPPLAGSAEAQEVRHEPEKTRCYPLDY